MDIKAIRDKFKNIYNSDPLIVKSPGRINVIGEHTDYNDGFVMPAAIDRGVYVAIAIRADRQVHLYSESYQQVYTTSLDQIKKSEMEWANYVLGVIDQMVKKKIKLGGFNIYLDGNVPLGAGVSSSAALECAVAFALNHIFSLNLSKMDLALIAQKAEHEFAGVNCGIMDQFASVFGKKNKAILLDCRSMDYSYLPLDLQNYRFVLFNTKVKHKLSESAYNKRRSQCEQGVALIKEVHPQITSLREVSLSHLDTLVKPVDLEIYRKCRYVIEEIARTQLAAEKLRAGDLTALGKLMSETHQGLSEAYEVSCPELDFLVSVVGGFSSVLGARMMGGGFGGCTINLIAVNEIEKIIMDLTTQYRNKFGISPDVYVVEIGEGASIVN